MMIFQQRFFKVGDTQKNWKMKKQALLKQRKVKLFFRTPQKHIQHRKELSGYFHDYDTNVDSMYCKLSVLK